jgi:hypothetical protein
MVTRADFSANRLLRFIIARFLREIKSVFPDLFQIAPSVFQKNDHIATMSA